MSNYRKFYQNEEKKYDMGNNFNKNNYGQAQIYETVSIQDQTQKVSNSTMCHTFSAAEFLVWRTCLENKMENQFIEYYQKIFGYEYIPGKLVFASYDSYDGGANKPIRDLLMQFIFLVENFKGDYYHYIKKHKRYDFPSNLTKEKIVAIISIWIDLLKKNEKKKGKYSEYNMTKYFDNLLNLIVGNKTNNYSMDIFNMEENNPNRGKFDLKTIPSEYMRACHHLEDEIKDPKNKNVELFGQNKLRMDYTNDEDMC